MATQVLFNKNLVLNLSFKDTWTEGSTFFNFTLLIRCPEDIYQLLSIKVVGLVSRGKDRHHTIKTISQNTLIRFQLRVSK